MMIHCCCRKCFYFREKTTNEGDCNRYPPGFREDAYSKKAVWPRVRDSDFCGEFMEKEFPFWKLEYLIQNARNYDNLVRNANARNIHRTRY